jgi:hypothetical protein
MAAGVLVLGLGTAQAFVATPGALKPAIGAPVVPAAMCGFRCEYGGRYIPGPPEVCYERGMRFCGPSRGGPDRPSFREERGGGFVERGCRTITIEREDGSVRRIRRCD